MAEDGTITSDQEALAEGAVQAELRLASLDAYVATVHGAPRALTSDEVGVLAAWGRGIVAHIRNRWPVDTGTSQDRWTFEVNPTPGEMAIVVENDMFYAAFVFRKGDPSRTPIWESLVAEAWERAREPMLREAREAVDATEAAFRATRTRQERAQVFGLRRAFERRPIFDPIPPSTDPTAPGTA